MIKGLAAAAALLLIGAAAEPWDWGTDTAEWYDAASYEESKAICRSVLDREPPAADRPDPAAAAALKGCDSEALLYGIGMPADPVKARHCAFVEAEAEQQGAGVFGRGTLMTIYANGSGVKQDLDVAIHLACGVDGAPAESHGRVLHLAALKRDGPGEEPFHFCDDVTSGFAGGICAGHSARIADAQRESEIAALTASWTAAEKEALAKLRAAYDAYAEAHAGGEIDMSGTLRGAFFIGAQQRLRGELLAMLRDLEGGRAPKLGTVDLRREDARLNAEYRRIIASFAKEEDFPGTVTKEGVRDAQRAWLRYRDAFLAFAAVRYPQLSRDGLAAWLTRQRTELLVNPPEI